jgi:hypothetical protein
MVGIFSTTTYFLSNFEFFGLQSLKSLICITFVTQHLVNYSLSLGLPFSPYMAPYWWGPGKRTDSNFCKVFYYALCPFSEPNPEEIIRASAQPAAPTPAGTMAKIAKFLDYF